MNVRRHICEFMTATLKKTEKCFQDQLSLNAGQTHCRMFQEEHSAILSTFIKLVIKIRFVLSIFEWPFNTGFTVFKTLQIKCQGSSKKYFAPVFSFMYC